MQELNQMLENLQQQLADKKSEIENSGTTPGANLLSVIQNRKNDIDFFATSIKDVSKDPTLAGKIIANFKADADKISLNIASIRIDNN